MSCQFSYELDERKIRLLMQDAEAEYNENMWAKVEAISKTEPKTSSIGSYIPSINLSINRSIIVPIVFVILIGSLSALLFSFVDFNKKEAINKEVPLIANPENFKKPDVKPQPIKQAIAITPSVAPNAIDTSKIDNQQPIITTTTIIKNNVTAAIETEANKKNSTTLDVVKETPTQPIKPIKPKNKMKVVALPTINAPIIINQTSSDEPDLDLK